MGYFLSITGYAMSFSAVLAKMWRVYYIFHNPTTGKRVRFAQHTNVHHTWCIQDMSMCIKCQ